MEPLSASFLVERFNESWPFISLPTIGVRMLDFLRGPEMPSGSGRMEVEIGICVEYLVSLSALWWGCGEFAANLKLVLEV